MTRAPYKSAPSSFDERVLRLERRALRKGAQGTCPGTAFARIVASSQFLAGHGVVIKSRHGDVNAWVLSVGTLHGPKQFFYGLSMLDCVKKAEMFLTAIKRRKS